MTLRAGTATTTITPENPMLMAGYGARTEPSTGTESDLEAGALALSDDGGTTAVLLTADLIGVPAEIRAAVLEACDASLPPEALLVNASHTHFGPRVRLDEFRRALLDPDEVASIEAYRERLTDELTAVVDAAMADRSPAEVAYSHARTGFAMNRRARVDDGFTIGPNPDRPVDHDVPVLSVRDPDGALRAVAFGYACHNTTLGADRRRFGADWAGYAKTHLREAHPDATPLFVTGAAGDQNPYPRGRTALSEQHGRALSNAVEAALAADGARVAGPIRAAYDEVALAFDDGPDRGELEARLESDDERERVKARYLLDRLDDGRYPAGIDYPVGTLRVGDLTLVALAGEPVVGYARRLDELIDGPAWVAGYSNAVGYYVPTPEIRYEGGYEGEGWVRYSPHPAPLDYATEERIVGTVREQLAALGG